MLPSLDHSPESSNIPTRKWARESDYHSLLCPLFSQSLPWKRDANRQLLCQSYLTSETQFPHPGQKSQNRQRSSFSVWWEEEICKQRIRKTDGMRLSLPCSEDLLRDLCRRRFLSAGPEFQALVEELFQLPRRPRKKRKPGGHYQSHQWTALCKHKP